MVLPRARPVASAPLVGDGAVGVDDDVGGAVNGDEFLGGDEAEVELDVGEAEPVDLLMELIEEVGCAGSDDDEPGVGDLGFDALPGVEQDVEALVGEEDALPED